LCVITTRNKPKNDMGNKLSAGDKLHIKQAFDHFDKDSSGTLTVAELQDALKISEHDAKAIVSSVDANGDGIVSFEEFCKVVEKKFLPAFHNIVKYDDLGLFTKSELKKAYSKAGVQINDKQIEEYFAALDDNNDNLISLKEFVIGSFVSFTLSSNNKK